MKAIDAEADDKGHATPHITSFLYKQLNYRTAKHHVTSQQHATLLLHSIINLVYSEELYIYLYIF